MTTENNNWAIREAKASDLNFIYSTFLKAYKHGSFLGKNVTSDIFFTEYQKIVDQLLAEASVLVACLKEDPAVILSYLVYQPEIIHFAFTKEHFRDLGITKSLIQTARIQTGQPMRFVTHKTYDSIPILTNHPELIFNPFLLYQTNKETIS